MLLVIVISVMLLTYDIIDGIAIVPKIALLLSLTSLFVFSIISLIAEYNKWMNDAENEYQLHNKIHNLRKDLVDYENRVNDLNKLNAALAADFKESRDENDDLRIQVAKLAYKKRKQHG